MTVAAITPVQTYLGNGSAAPLAVPFRFLAADDLVVTRIAPGNVRTVLARGIHYSVTGAGGTAGSVTPLAPIPAGTSWEVARATARTQPADYLTGDSFPAETHELALDRMMLAVQEQDVATAAVAADGDDTAARALRAVEGEVMDLLPPKAELASRVLGFDNVGDPIAVPSNLPDVAAQVAELQALFDSFTFTTDGGSVYYTNEGVTYLVDMTAQNGVLFSRPIFGWNQSAGLGSARFGSFCKITDTTGLFAYSPRHAIVNDGEIGMRLDVVPYTLNIAAQTLTLGAVVTVETPTGFASGVGAAWAGQPLRLSSGRILLFYMFLNTPDGTYTHPDSRSDICLRYSDNGGATWSAKQTLAAGETAYASFGVADYNAPSAGLNIAGGINHVVQTPGGRIVLTGYLINAGSHYLASIYTDNADGITGWAFGAPLVMAANYNEPSVALTETGLAAFVRHEATDGRGIFYSTNGQIWVFDRLETGVPIQNVASSAYTDGNGKTLVGGATAIADNRQGYKLFSSTNEGASFGTGFAGLFNAAERIGYSLLGEIAPGYYGLVHDISSVQAPNSFNQKSSVYLTVFNPALLAGAATITRTPDSQVYVAATEYAAYAAYVTGDGGTVQDAAACLAAITAAIAGDYYSSIGYAISARWGHKNLGAANYKLYSLNLIKNDQSSSSEAVSLDTTSFAYAVAKFDGAASAAWLQFDGLILRKGAQAGAVIMEKSATLVAGNGILMKWTDVTLHYFYPSGAVLDGIEFLSNNPGFITNNTLAFHTSIDFKALTGLGGHDGIWDYGAAWFNNRVALNETASVRIQGGVSNALLAEAWFFNGPNLTAEMVRQCGADVGARY